MSRRLQQQVLVAIVAFSAAAPANAAIELNLREQVELKSSVVRLEDVAAIVGASDAFERRLADLPLMPTPAPGTKRFLRKREIADLLSAHGVALSDVAFSGATQVAVASMHDGWKQSQEPDQVESSKPLNRRTAILAGRDPGPRTAAIDMDRAAQVDEEVRRAILTYLQSRTDESGDWQVTCDVPNRQLRLLGHAATPLTCQGGTPPWTGRQRFLISFSTREGAVQVPVYAEVKAPAVPTVVAVHPIDRGDVITAAHLDVQTMRPTRGRNDRSTTFDSVDSLIGMEARRSIQAGEVVTSEQVQPRILVERGDVITVSSVSGGIRIRTTARAKQEGAKGELVQVESLDTRERYDVRVVGPREAAILSVTRSSPSPVDARVETARK